MQRDLLFVANWKMQLSYKQSIQFVDVHRDDLRALAHNHSIIICPSFDALSSLGELLKDTGVELGAQDVSMHARGAYTGQVAATSLKEVGCSYCIIGHSERRQYNAESSEHIAHKIIQTAAVGITPLICIGETAAQKKAGHTATALQEQLDPLIDTIKLTPLTSVGIAYEPVWAIGTGSIPTNKEIALILEWIRKYIHATIPAIELALLYGGSVTPDNALSLSATEGLDGFLIGGASTDFKKFQKIVLLDDKA